MNIKNFLSDFSLDTQGLELREIIIQVKTMAERNLKNFTPSEHLDGSKYLQENKNFLFAYDFYMAHLDKISIMVYLSDFIFLSELK